MLYQVDDTARQVLKDLVTLPEWFEFMGTLDLDEAARCDVEDSWALWREATRELDPPLSLLFTGELKPDEEEGGDPDAGFIGAPAVRDIHRLLESRGRSYFAAQLEDAGYSSEADIWLYEELCGFLADCVIKEKAVLFLLS